MELDVSRGFVHPATPFSFETSLTLEAQDVGGETVTFDPVKLKGTYFVVDDTVRLEGKLMTRAHAACAVCLAPAEKAVEIDFDETFRKDANETEDECFRYEGKSVPLDHMALTLAMLNLPMRFVWRQPELPCRRGAEGLERRGKGMEGGAGGRGNIPSLRGPE